MAPTIKNIVFKNIRNHHTTTIIDEIHRKRDGKPLERTPETEAMVRDREEITRNKGKENIAAMEKAHEEKRHDVDGMTDEELGRISIWIAENSDSTEESEQAVEAYDVQALSKFNEYKHHQYVRRWGLFKDSDGRDEEWFIADPAVLDEDDPEYLCAMCRHIDFGVLLSKRGLPGNQQPGSTSIELLGLANIMNENSNCAFCRLLRRRIAEDVLLSDVHPNDWGATSFNLNVLDDGPGYALRLEIEIPDVKRLHSRFVIHQVADGSDQPQALQGLAVQQDAADMSRLQGWLRTCNESHQSLANSTDYLKPLMSALRVIDTIENCVKEVNTPCEYICLSYVWGTGSQTQYTTHTRDQLSKPGGLEEVTLPQTILDAMKVTRDLGMRYVWVDALCITQDDNEDKARIMSNMGTIYANSVLTIMASTNVNPTDGLPGVGITRSRKQSIEKLQGITLAIASQDARQRYLDIEDQPWNTRAWTFQERVLSQRSVYFTNSQMCFVCPHGAIFEDTVPALDSAYKITPFNDQTQLNSRLFDLWMRVWVDPTQSRYINKAFETDDSVTIMVGEDPDRPGEASEDSSPLYKFKAIASHDTIDAPLIKGDTLWEAYAHAVDAYTKRNMTMQSDAVNAFVGIADLIRRGTNTKFWYGMPEFALTRSLLWQPQEPLKRRVSRDGEPLFPSWAWAAWQGHVSYRGRGWHNAVGFAPATMVKWLRKTTIEECLGNFTLVERTDEEIKEFFQQIQGVKNLYEQPSPTELFHLDYQELGWKVEHDKVRNQHIFVHEAYPGVRLEYPISLPGQSIIDLPSEDGILSFNARVAPAQFCDMSAKNHLMSPIQDTFLQIGLHDEDRSSNKRKFWRRIIYHQGYRAGSLSLNVPTEVLKLGSNSEDSRQNEGTEESYSIVAISRDGLPHIAPPPIGWDLYWTGDPLMMQEKVLRDEWSQYGVPPPVPDENVVPDESKVNETGDPRWDEGRFGGVSILDVCNVLLLRKREGGFSERIGVGKMSYCAFYAAKPEVDLVVLK